MLGSAGPDQGYALRLARLMSDQLRLLPGEHLEDVIAGGIEIAMKRAARFGRAPVRADAELAFTLWGFLGDPPDDELVARGHGITDLQKLPTPRDIATDAGLRAGVGPLFRKVAIWRPAAVIFVYKRAAEACAGRSLLEPWGRIDGVALAARPCFLMPGPYAARDDVSAGLNLIRNLAAAIEP